MKNLECSVKRIRADEVEQVVVNHFSEVMSRAGYFRAIEEKLSSTLKSNPAQSADLSGKLRKELKSLENEIASTFRIQASVSGGGEGLELVAEHLEKMAQRKKILVNYLPNRRIRNAPLLSNLMVV